MIRLAPLAALAALLCACGGKVVTPMPQTVVGKLPKEPSAVPTTVPKQYVHGDAAAGRQVFLSKGCTGCHTLKDAGATGTVGPNLNQVQPTLPVAVQFITHGKGAMPSFKGSLSDTEIADVAAYVVKASRQG